MKSIKHILDQKVDEKIKERLLKKGEALITATQDEIANRNHWIRCREEQKRKLEEIQAETYQAYDKSDEQAMDSLNAKLREILAMNISKRSGYVNRLQERDYGDSDV